MQTVETRSQGAFITISTTSGMISPRTSKVRLPHPSYLTRLVPVAHLMDVPNQPIAFWAEKNGTVGRTEDRLIAYLVGLMFFCFLISLSYTWKHFIENPNEPDWLLRNPMVKEVVMCMYLHSLIPMKSDNRGTCWKSFFPL